MASFRLHIGDSGTIYHVDDCCLSFPDTAEKVLSICQVCNNSSSAFEIGRSVFVSEQGQKFHLTRYCRTFKNLPMTEYSMCSACGTPGDSVRRSVLPQRAGTSQSEGLYRRSDLGFRTPSSSGARNLSPSAAEVS